MGDTPSMPWGSLCRGERAPGCGGRSSISRVGQLLRQQRLAHRSDAEGEPIKQRGLLGRAAQARAREGTHVAGLPGWQCR